MSEKIGFDSAEDAIRHEMAIWGFDDAKIDLTDDHLALVAGRWSASRPLDHALDPLPPFTNIFPVERLAALAILNEMYSQRKASEGLN